MPHDTFKEKPVSEILLDHERRLLCLEQKTFWAIILLLVASDLVAKSFNRVRTKPT